MCIRTYSVRLLLCVYMCDMYGTCTECLACEYGAVHSTLNSATCVLPISNLYFYVCIVHLYVHVFLCDCVSPFPTAVSLPLSKACEVLSEQLQTLGLQQDKVRCVYVGDGDRRETVVSCVRPSLHSHLLFSSPLPCHFFCSLYLPTLVLWRQGGEGGDRWGGMVLGWGMSV